jgi:uncharacterized protein
MVGDVNRFPLRTLRLRAGEELQVPVTLAIEPFGLGGQRYAAKPEEISTTLVVQRTTGGTVFALRLQTTVEGPCMRCLEPATADVQVDVREYSDDDADAEEELRSEYVVADHLELSAWARDAVALALPDRILCGPDCAGLCPRCGLNLNRESHTHEDTDLDPRWAALETLRDE